MMRGLWKICLIECKLFLREPEAVFFTLAFPLILLFVFGSIFGNDPIDDFGGLGMLDISVPAYMIMIIANTGLMGIPSIVSSYRERKILRRLQAAPIRPQTILAALALTFFVETLLGSLLLIVAGKIFYGLRFEGNIISIFLAFTLSTLSFFAFGFMLASVVPTARTASLAGSVFFFPMMFLSGATIPWEMLPETVQKVSYTLPMTHAVQLLQQLWAGEPWSAQLTKVGVLIGTFIVGMIVSAKTFRWE